jgi:hypothetical protein
MLQIQHVLLLAIAGLVVLHLYGSREGYTGADSRAPPPFGDLEPRGARGIAHLSVGDTGTIDVPRDAAVGPGTGIHAPPTIDEGGEDDPRDLPWIASWSPADRAARSGQNCHPTYTEAGPHGTTILSAAPSCESGMAHTRPRDRIVIPVSVPLAHRDTTIRHELIHIHQRRNPEAWATFYRRNWSFTLRAEPPADIPDSLRLARRSNPDTWTTAWACWQGRYWPVAVYTSPTNPRLRDAVTVWWDSWRQAVLTEPPQGWTEFFGSPSQNEHPHEIAAVLLVDEDRESEAGRRLAGWWESTGQSLWGSREDLSAIQPQ